MSYLEMTKAPLPNLSKAIISVWFKNAAKNGPGEPWNEIIFPPPPNTFSAIPLSDYTGDFFNFYNPYGEPANILAMQGPYPLIYPLIPVGRVGVPVFKEGTFELNEIPPVVAHDQFNIIMSFGNPNLAFQHRKWIGRKISSFDGVLEISGFGTVSDFDDRPMPYNPYYKLWPSGPKKGQPLGVEGKMPVVALRLEQDATSYTRMIPQSFIGIDSGNRLRICLQTDNRADYKGYMFVQSKAKELFMDYSRRDFAGPWYYFGPFWAGWEFEHQDTSNDLMTQWPEFFVLQGPEIQDGWNHLLFSFDISGQVSATQDADSRLERAVSKTCSTSCRAWLALNGRNITDLQNPYPMPKFYAPPTTISSFFGPVSWGGPIMSSFSSGQLGLKANQIVPQNVFATSWQGIPKQAMHHAYATVQKDYITAEFWARQGTDFGDGIPTLYRGAGGGAVPVHNGRGHPTTLTTPNPDNLAKPSYRGGPFSIPTEGFPIGLPTGNDLLGHNMGCEMAELQIWSGRTIDTGVMENRRLFITEEGKPQDMKKAEDILGPPDIRLQGSPNWKSGKNTGTIGRTFDGQPNPDGQFAAVAKIGSYKPDPEIGK